MVLEHVQAVYSGQCAGLGCMYYLLTSLYEWRLLPASDEQGCRDEDEHVAQDVEQEAPQPVALDGLEHLSVPPTGVDHLQRAVLICFTTVQHRWHSSWSHAHFIFGVL